MMRSDVRWGKMLFAMVLAVGFTACGGPSGSGATSGGSTTTITGSGGDGPVTGGAVSVTDANGAAVTTTPANPVTGSDAKFSFTVPSGTALPLTITVTGGTDTVTGNTQDFPLKTAVTTLPASGTVTGNANPLSTLAVESAGALSGGLTAANLTTATNNVLGAMGFGLAAGVNPISTPVDNSNVANIVRANEAVAEMIRRASNASGGTLANTITSIAQDITDGVVDGKTIAGASNTQVSNTTASHILNEQAQVSTEVLANNLTVTTPAGATIASASGGNFSTTLNSSITTTGHTGDVASDAPTQAFLDQTRTAINIANTLTGGGNAALNNLLGSVNALTAGTVPSTTQKTSLTTLAGAATFPTPANITANATAATTAATAAAADTTAPAMPTITSPTASTTTNTTSLTITGTAETNAVVTVLSGTTSLGTATANGATTGAVSVWTLTVTLPDAAHAIKATASDAAGNTSAASAVAATITVDTVAATNQNTVLAVSITVAGGGSVTIASSGTASNNVWLAPATTTTFTAGATMTKATSGTATSIIAPATAGAYKLFVLDAVGNVSAASTATVTVDTTAPTNQNTVLAASITVAGGGSVTIVSSGTAGNNVWLAPSGTTTFTTGATMTKAASGTATSIIAPATGGTYKLFVIDAVGNVSTASTATVTVDTTAPTNQNTVLVASITVAGGGSVTIVSSGTAGNNVWLAPSGTTVFTTGATMTKAANGTATSIIAPATGGAYKLFVLDAVGNASNASTNTVTVDTTPPVLSSFTSTTADGSYKAAASINITATYNEALAGTSTLTVSLNSGKTGLVLNTVSGSTITGTYTVSATETSAGLTVSLITSQNVSDAVGNALTTTTLPTTNIATGSTIVVDTTAAPPAIALTTDSGSSATDKITNIGTLTTTGLETGATVEYSTDGGTTWAASFTATAGANSVQVRQTDVAGNVSGASTALAFNLDTAAPTATLSTTSSSPTNVTPIPVTLTFNEAVTGVVLGDFTVGNGVASNLTPSSSTVYTVDITPTAAGAVTVDIAINAAVDSAGNGNAAAMQLSVTFNHVPTANGVQITDNNGGIPALNDVLTGSYTYDDVDGDGEGISTFRWLRDGVAITSATVSTYTLVAADNGKVITFEVTPVAATGSSPGVAASSSNGMSGAVVDGKVGGATLTLYSDQAMTALVGSGSTDSVTGAFSVIFTTITPPDPVYIKATGGTDISTGMPAPTMLFVGNTAGSNALTSLNITPLTNSVFTTVANNNSTTATANQKLSSAITTVGSTVLGLSTPADVFADPTVTASLTTGANSPLVQALNSGTVVGTVGAGNYKFSALVTNETNLGSDPGTAGSTSIADVKTLLVTADITVAANGGVSLATGGAITGITGATTVTGQVQGSSVILDFKDASSFIVRIVGQLGLNGSLSGNTTKVTGLPGAGTMTKGLFVGSVIPATGINIAGLKTFVSNFYAPGAGTGTLNIVAKDTFVDFATQVPRVRWGQADLLTVDSTLGTASMGDITMKVDALSKIGASSLFTATAGEYVRINAKASNILIFEFTEVGGNKLYLVTVLGLRRGIYLRVASTGAILTIGESYMTKKGSNLAPGLKASTTYDIGLADVHRAMIGLPRQTLMSIIPIKIPGMAIPAGFTSNNALDSTNTGGFLSELNVFQGSTLVMKKDANDNFTDNPLSAIVGGTFNPTTTVEDHLRAIQFSASGAVEGENSFGGSFSPGMGAPTVDLKGSPCTFIGFFHDTSSPDPSFKGQLNFMARTIYESSYASFATAYLFGDINITLAPTAAAPGTATLTATDANGAAVSIPMVIDKSGKDATPGTKILAGIYHMHGTDATNTSFKFVDLFWPVGGGKATYVVSDGTTGLGNIVRVGEAFITQ